MLKNIKKSPLKRYTSPVRTIMRYEGSLPLRTCKIQKLINRNLRLNDRLKSIGHIVLEKEVVKENALNSNSCDQLYLLDYGLASKYLGNKGHREYDRDERKAHAGTLLFCSLDAHIGSQSRRSDLECLGYNMIYWLTGSLPWMDNIEDPIIVEKIKKRCLYDLKVFLNKCFNQYPKFLYDYFKYLGELEFESKPDYLYLKKLFENAIKEYGYNNNWQLDFDNKEGWGKKLKKLRKNDENSIGGNCKISRFKNSPIHSNSAKPLLRKKVKSINDRELNWSKLLLNDPEVLIKQAKIRDRKFTDTMDNSSGLQNLDINELQPTYHMIKVYNRFIDKLNNALGYTPSSNYDWYVMYLIFKYFCFVL